MAGDLNPDLLLTEATASEPGPKLEIGVHDPAAFEAWCAERGFTPKDYLERLQQMLTPRD